MVITRRKLNTLLFTSALFPSVTQAFPLTKLLGDPSPEYTRIYLKRFWKWYNLHWAPIEAKMSGNEKSLFLNCLSSIEHFGNDISIQDKKFFLENFLIRQHWDGSQLKSAKYYMAPKKWSPETHLLFKSILHEFTSKDFAPELFGKSLFGWSRDLDSSSFKIYFNKPSQLNLTFDEGKALLGFVEFKDKMEFRRGLIIPHKDVPEIGHPHLDKETILSGFQILDNHGNENWKLRMRSTYLVPFGKEVMRFGATHKKEFHQAPDLISVSKSGHFKAYYP